MSGDNKEKKIYSLIYLLIILVAFGLRMTWALDTSTFNQTINSGVLLVDIVDNLYASVASPSVIMSTKTTSSSCYTGVDASTGILGTSTQQIYIDNPDQADNGWTVTIAASNPTDTWSTGALDYDFNDPGTLTDGCTDTGTDADSFAGQLTIDPSGATLANGQCSGCDTTNVTLGSAASFDEGSIDNITVVSAAASANDIADYTIQGVDISQTIPAGQGAGVYTLDLTLTIVAN